MLYHLACTAMLLGCVFFEHTAVYKTASGGIRFWSDAPLEFIEAKSDALRGVVDSKSNEFAFSVQIASFQGFNSPLQLEHFNENYLETSKYPQATFTGKIIETVDFSKPGQYFVRAKGKLRIHGVERERIIRSTLEVLESGDLLIRSSFSVLLEEHQIQIPKMVYQKIAEEIEVEVEMLMKPSR